MTSPITLAPKDPNERLAYTWTPQEGDAISGTPTITVTSGTATIDGSVTKIDADATARFNLIGGAHGEVTKLTALATMASGDIIEQTILIRIRNSSDEPTAVTMQAVKEYLRYDASETDQDTTLGILLAGAQNWVERHTGHVLVRREVTQYVGAFGSFVELAHFPYVSGLAIAYRDTAGGDQEIDDATVVNEGGVYRAYPAAAWPATATQPGIVLTYTAGYATPEDVPGAMLQAMCLIAAMTDDERGGAGESDKAWKSVEWLLESYRKPGMA